MRIRRRPWARPELEACDFFLKDPKSNLRKVEASFSKSAAYILRARLRKRKFYGRAGK